MHESDLTGKPAAASRAAERARELGARLLLAAARIQQGRAFRGRRTAIATASTPRWPHGSSSSRTRTSCACPRMWKARTTSSSPSRRARTWSPTCPASGPTKRIAARSLGIYRISEDAARRANRQRVSVVTTLGSRCARSSRGADNRHRSWRRSSPLLDVYRHSISWRSGVRVAIGSDQFPGTSLPEALAIHQAGLMAPSALLRALTTDAAATIFPERAPFGLAEGAPADFLVFDGNPLADFTAIQRVRRRVKAGEEVPGA
jgi:hypothetical protein